MIPLFGTFLRQVLRLLRVLLISGAVAGRVCHAVDDERGGLRGKVSDADFSAPIAGATVTVEGAGMSATSNPDGSFTISGLPPGRYEVMISREGFTRQRLADVVINPGAFTEKSVQMSGEIMELEDFVVTTDELIPEGGAQALDIQQGLSGIAQVIGQEFISKLGAANVGQALTKVVGVSVVGDRYIVIRGLADRYNAVLLNNAGVPSSDPDRRVVNIDLFPGSIVKYLQTSKTFTPDLPGEATGGSIDIGTKGIPEKSLAKYKIGLGMNTQATGNSRFLSYQGGGTGFLGTLDSRRMPDFVRGAALPRFFPSTDTQEKAIRDQVNSAFSRTMGTTPRTPGPDLTFETTVGHRGEFFGVPAGGILALDYRKSYDFVPDGIRASSGDKVGTVLRFQRGVDKLRGGLLLAGGVEPQKGDEIKATLFSNLVAEDRARLAVGPKDIASGSTGPDDYTYRESLAYTERRLSVLQASGRHHWEGGDLDERFVLKWVASYNIASQDEPDHRFVETDSDPNLKIFSAPDATDIPLFRRYWREVDDDRWNIGLDFDYVLFGTEEKKTKVKLGTSFDKSGRDYQADNFAYEEGRLNNGAFPNPNKPLPFPGATWADVFLYGNPKLSDRPLTDSNATHPFRFGNAETYRADQHILAGYALLDADFSPSLNVNIGFRVEQTQLDLTADLVQIAENGGDAELAVQVLKSNDPDASVGAQNVLRNAGIGPAEAQFARENSEIQTAGRVNIHEVSVLPALTVKWRLTDQINLRSAVTRTIARPSFKELAPVPFRDAESGDIFIGNRNLTISSITNYDVRLEFYPKKGGTFAITGFSKFIDDPIELSRASGNLRYVNSTKATVYGFEIEAEHDLAFVAPEFRHITLSGNYTFLRSVVPRTFFSEQGPFRRLQGQPDYLFNFNLTYDNAETGFSAGIFLNVTGAYLDQAGFSNSPDIIAEPSTRLSAFIAYKFSKYGKVTLRGSNLTSDDARKVLDLGGKPTFEYESSGPTYSLSYEGAF